VRLDPAEVGGVVLYEHAQDFVGAEENIDEAVEDALVGELPYGREIVSGDGAMNEVHAFPGSLEGGTMVARNAGDDTRASLRGKVAIGRLLAVVGRGHSEGLAEEAEEGAAVTDCTGGSDLVDA